MTDIQLILVLSFAASLFFWRYRWFRVPAKIIGSILLTVVIGLISQGAALMMMIVFMVFIEAAEEILCA